MLGKRRGRWIAYLRAQNSRAEERRREEQLCPDGMCSTGYPEGHGIIPFGAIRYSSELEVKRLAKVLAQPVPVRRLGVDEIGVTLAVVCPYCREAHQHVFAEETLDVGAWDPEAACGRGWSRWRRPSGCFPRFGDKDRQENAGE